MFTQRDEEKYIRRHFQKLDNGMFLDIGAYDGQCFSTTRALALRGWEGVCVEPSPSVMPALRERYEDDPAVSIIEAAITNVTGEVDFYDSGGDMISSVDSSHVEKWKAKAGCTFNKIKVDSYTVADLFIKIGYDFDFISLDVEGTNLQILEQFPFKMLNKTSMLCIEFDLQPKRVMGLVEPYGFSLIHQTCENMLLTR